MLLLKLTTYYAWYLGVNVQVSGQAEVSGKTEVSGVSVPRFRFALDGIFDRCQGKNKVLTPDTRHLNRA